jgi:hypothetical protein
MAKDDIRKHGAVTEYQPERDDVSGGSDKSVQTEARGAEGAANLANSSASSSGSAGEIESIDRDERSHRPGKPDPSNRDV